MQEAEEQLQEDGHSREDEDSGEEQENGFAEDGDLDGEEDVEAETQYLNRLAREARSYRVRSLCCIYITLWA